MKETNKKLFKPRTCQECPAVEIKKGEIICKCMRELKANISDSEEKVDMWKKCPLAWDIEEKNIKKY